VDGGGVEETPVPGKKLRITLTKSIIGLSPSRRRR